MASRATDAWGLLLRFSYLAQGLVRSSTGQALKSVADNGATRRGVALTGRLACERIA